MMNTHRKDRQLIEIGPRLHGLAMTAVLGMLALLALRVLF